MRRLLDHVARLLIVLGLKLLSDDAKDALARHLKR